MPKQLLYIYKKALKIPENGFFGNNTWQEKAKFWAKSPKKNAFSHKKWSKRPSEAKIWPGFLILVVVYHPFELKIHQKVCHLDKKNRSLTKISFVQKIQKKQP